MRAVVRITPGPRWLSGKSVYHQGSLIDAHLRYMRDCFDDHSLLIGGPVAGGMAGVAILEVPDLEAARSLVDSDPAVVGGVLRYSVDELVPFFDVVSGVRAGDPAAGTRLRPRVEFP